MVGVWNRLILGLVAVCSIVPLQAEAKERTTVPMASLAHLTVVEVLINGKGPYQMVLDTGAGVTVLHKDLARHLGAPTVGRVEVGGPMQGTPIIADSISLDSVRLGDVDFRGLEAVALDLDEVFKPLNAPDGILSVQALKGRLITLDHVERTVVLHDAPLVASEAVAVLEYAADQPVPAVQMTVGGISVRADLDSGSPALISMPLDYADKLPLESKPRPSGQGRTVDATFEIVSSRLNGNLELGHFALENPMISFPNRGDRVVLGSQFLERFAVTFDNDRRLVGFEEGQSQLVSGKGRPGGPKRMAVGKKRYGIAFRAMTGDFLTVERVDSGLAAESGGLKAGDKIVEMNGVAVKEMNVSQRIAALQGSPLHVIVERGGSTVELTMSLD